MNSKRVRFSTVIHRHIYENEISDIHSSNDRQNSLRRRHCETLMVRKPSLNQVQDVFDQCRIHPISIVFGNMGRQPRLLDYYLDLYFTSSETVGVKAQWPTGSPYEIEKSTESTISEAEVDFLFVLEPYFGYTIVKPTRVAHLVVFSSHLCLVSPNTCERYFFLQVAPHHRIAIPTELSYTVPWTPPVFYDDSSSQMPMQPKHVMIDVTSARCAHEAYLRCLTGRELLSDRPHSIDIKKEHQETLNRQLERSRNAVTGRWATHPSLEEWYWKGYEKTPTSPHIHTFILRRNPLSL